MCGSRFTVRPRVVITPRSTSVRSEPDACPACDAPLKTVPALDVGLARGLVLVAAGFAAERRAHGTAERYLRDFTRTERDVERLLKLALALDHDEWAQEVAARLRRRETRDLMALSRFLPRLRAQVDRGTLGEGLERAAQRVRARYRAERERRLAIRRGREQAR